MIGRTKALTMPSSSAAAIRRLGRVELDAGNDLRGEPQPDRDHYRANEEPFHERRRSCCAASFRDERARIRQGVAL